MTGRFLLGWRQNGGEASILPVKTKCSPGKNNQMFMEPLAVLSLVAEPKHWALGKTASLGPSEL